MKYFTVFPKKIDKLLNLKQTIIQIYQLNIPQFNAFK